MSYIIFDLEATCWEGDYDRPETNPETEIIEIGAVKLNDNLEIIDTYQTFVKPKLHPNLSAFAKELTTIKQEEVDAAPGFPEAMYEFGKWIGVEEPYVLCSWGFYDKKQLLADANLHNMQLNTFKHISIKHQHGEMLANDFLREHGSAGAKQAQRIARGVGMNKAMELLGLEPEGTHHRGICDAKNIAKIFVEIFPKLTFE